MARFVENPRPHSKTLDEKFTRQIFLLLTVALAAALAYQLSPPENRQLVLGGFLVFIISYIARKVFIQMGKNDRGSAGERQVRDVLSQLSDEYVVFQNVPIKDRLDIDMVLVGPRGIFAIEVKSHKGYNSYSRTRFISQTFAETMALKEHLKRCGVDVYVRGVLVFSGAPVRYASSRKGVSVVSKEYLLPLLDRVQRMDYDVSKAAGAIKQLYGI